MILTLIIAAVSLSLLIVSIRAIAIAFFKKKDERSKWIVTKSMAEAFVIVVVLQFALCLVKWLAYDLYQKWWHGVMETVYIEPVMLSFMILGLILLVNTKRHGGAL